MTVAANSEACGQSTAAAEAWSLLDDMARAFPDDEKFNGLQTRRRRAGPSPSGWTNFTRNVDDSHAGEVFTPSRMPFWAAGAVVGLHAAKERRS